MPTLSQRWYFLVLYLPLLHLRRRPFYLGGSLVFIICVSAIVVFARWYKRFAWHRDVPLKALDIVGIISCALVSRLPNRFFVMELAKCRLCGQWHLCIVDSKVPRIGLRHTLRPPHSELLAAVKISIRM